MELLAPAGNLEKLKYAYLYGADAAYIGIQHFSLRQKADNFHADEHEYIKKIKGRRKLYGALNIYFHRRDLEALEAQREYLALYPFDAFIVSDIGAVPFLKKHFPDTEIHLSTQANCINAEAARIYRDMGFTRIVPGREMTLDDIRRMKDRLPDLEIEAFVHGALCLAYSGRCFLSAWMADRSGNKGDCAHSCRWEYRVLEEKERPGEYYPVFENETFTSLLSSRDICMINHLKEMQEAGVDSLKIEGRMKSIYYTAVVTRAYRKALQKLSGQDVPELEAYKAELDKVSHREFSTGFYFGSRDIEKPTERSYLRPYLFLGALGEPLGGGRFRLIVKNQLKADQEIEYIGPDILYRRDKGYTLYDEEGRETTQADHGKVYSIRPGCPAETGFIIRREKTNSRELP